MTLIERVKNILLTPKTEWPVIAGESGDTAFLFRNYVAILAAIPPICGFIGGSIIGVAGYRSGFFIGLIGAVASYLLAFVGTYVMAVIINLLAPNFGGQNSFPNALKLVVYSSTAAWVAGIFSLIPALAILSVLLGLYSLYLLFLGLPVLMKSPPDKTLVYTVAAIVCAVIVWIIIGAIPALVFIGSRF